MKVIKISFIVLCIMIMFCSRLLAEGMTEHVSVSVHMGNWQPHSLNDEPRFETFGAAGATPFYAFSLTIPVGRAIAVRSTLGYWALQDLEEVEKVHSLTLHPFSIDIKYWLVPDYRLSAYVIYGGSVYWGIENETLPFGEDLRTAQSGWGGNLGAGVDLHLMERLGLGVTFQYKYVQFAKPLGGVEDFSGPQWAVTASYFLF